VARRPDLEHSDHVLAFELPLRSSRLIVLGSYHHVASHSLPGLLKSARAAVDTRLPVLFIGDLNAEHADWGCAETDPAGRQLAALCDDLDLSVLNTIHCPGRKTYFKGNTSTLLDLAITTHPLLFEDAVPDEETPLLSDHLPLKISLAAGHQPAVDPPRSYAEYDYHAANWDLSQTESEPYFRELLRLWPSLLQGTPQEQADFVNNELEAVLLGCLARCAPLRQIQIGGRLRLPQRVLVKRDAWHRAFRHYQRNYSAASRQEMLKRRKEWLGAFRAVKAELHAKRCERLNNVGPSEFWKHWARAHPRDRAPLSNILDRNGAAPASAEQALNNLADYFAEQCQPNEKKHPSPEEKHAKQRWESEDASRTPGATDEPFTDAEVSRGCDTVKVNSAMGPDRIHPLCLKHLGPLGRQFLTRLGNLTLQLGTLPTAWKRANIVPIYKKDGDRSDPKNYRGVSLTSIPGKLFERLLDKRLRLKLEPQLSRWQAGFRSRFSTVDQLFRLRVAASRAVRNKSRLPVAFLDISRAFDKAWLPGLMLKLERMGITGRAWAWIKSFLSGRQLRAVDKGQSSDWFAIRAGVPQGAVLSPLLFLVYINDIIADDDCDCALFADDVALWPKRSGPRGDAALQDSLDRMSCWAETWRLAFNVKKSAVLVFRGGRSVVDRDEFLLGAAKLPFCDSYKYLGLVFWHNLDWWAHGEELLKRVRGSMFAICGMIQRGASPSAMVVRKLVITICAAQISYGMPIFRPDAKLCEQLDQLMASPLRQALRLPKGAPAVPVLTEFGLLTTDHLYGKSALWFARRAMTLDDSHPTARQWAAEAKGAERSEVRQYEAVVGDKAIAVTNELADHRMQQRQISDWWDEEDKKHVLPVKLLKLNTGPSRYLILDNREAASRRARLRFDRSGLQASLKQRRLTANENCPDCKGEPDTADHVLLRCPTFDQARRACGNALARVNCHLNSGIAMGGVEDLSPQQQLTVLHATAGLLMAIGRIAARRRRA